MRCESLGRARQHAEQPVGCSRPAIAPAAALVEKFTNGLDAILLRRCKAAGIDPRSIAAPQTMSKAVQNWFGDLSEKIDRGNPRYRGGKSRPLRDRIEVASLPIVLRCRRRSAAENFPSTFCSLIYGSDEGSYKGAVPFVQGRFNMGGTGVLPFCGDDRKMQLIVSRVPSDVVKSPHEWGFTIFCFFPSQQSPSWKYLVGTDGKIMTAGSEPLGLVPKTGAKSGEVCAPRERKVPHGTLIKMYDYKAPRSNICGELFRSSKNICCGRCCRCASSSAAPSTRPMSWASRCGTALRHGRRRASSKRVSRKAPASRSSSRPARRSQPRSASSRLDDDAAEDAERPQTGLRALINGQSHAKRDTQFFKGKAVDKEHIGGSMLVTLDCSDLGQTHATRCS